MTISGSAGEEVGVGEGAAVGERVGVGVRVGVGATFDADGWVGVGAGLDVATGDLRVSVDVSAGLRELLLRPGFSRNDEDKTSWDRAKTITTITTIKLTKMSHVILFAFFKLWRWEALNGLLKGTFAVCMP